MLKAFDYDVFVSYSHRDGRFVGRLSRWLRLYRPPQTSRFIFFGRHLRVFRDKTEAAGTKLTEGIQTALERSRKLVVVCSPAARTSDGVADEIRHFAAVRGAEHIIAILAGGRPNNEAKRTGSLQQAAFPAALLEHMQGEPWAPDFRKCRGPFMYGCRADWNHLLAAICDQTRSVIERRAFRTRVLAFGLAIALLLTSSALALTMRRGQQQRASQELARRAIQTLGEKPRAALELAVQALETAPTVAAVAAARTVTWEVFSNFPRDNGAIAVDRSGRHLAMASPLGTARIFELSTQQEHVLCGHDGRIGRLDFSPDGRWLVGQRRHTSENGDGPVGLIWSVSDGTQVGTLDGGLMDYWISPDGEHMVARDYAQQFVYRDLPSGRKGVTLSQAQGLTRLQFSRSGRLFATFNRETPGDAGFVLWDSRDAKALWSTPATVRWADFSDDETKLIASEGNRFFVVTIDMSARTASAQTFAAVEFDYNLLRGLNLAGTRAQKWDSPLMLALAAKHPATISKEGLPAFAPLNQGRFFLLFQPPQSKRGSGWVFQASDLSLVGKLPGWPFDHANEPMLSDDGSVIVQGGTPPSGNDEETWIWRVPDASPMSATFTRFTGEQHRLGNLSGNRAAAIDTKIKLAQLTDALDIGDVMWSNEDATQLVTRGLDSASVWALTPSSRTRVAHFDVSEQDRLKLSEDKKALLPERPVSDPAPNLEPEVALRIARFYADRCRPIYR